MIEIDFTPPARLPQKYLRKRKLLMITITTSCLTQSCLLRRRVEKSTLHLR